MLIKFLFEQIKEYYNQKKLLEDSKNIYPTWLYHRFFEPQLVNTKAEHESIGKSWQKVPFKEPEKQIAKTKQSQTSEDEADNRS